nr:MAG TPA: hypothetical protein [Caudoviricetes sp.]
MCFFARLSLRYRFFNCFYLLFMLYYSELRYVVLIILYKARGCK